MSKYWNTKVKTSDGLLHDSTKEANRWVELRLMERAGVIKDLKRQVKYELLPKQGKERSVDYIADFEYIDVASGKKVVEDVKGYRNTSSAAYSKFVIKRKMMLYFHGIEVKEV